MINHLSEDQISRWFVGEPTTTEQEHVRACHTCASELDRFLGTLESFRVALSERAERLTRRSAPSLSMVLQRPPVLTSRVFPGITPTPDPMAGEAGGIWSKSDFRHTRWLSLLVHAAILALLIVPATITRPLPPVETLVMLYDKSLPLIARTFREEPSQGGGGGGTRTPAPPSKGALPRGADQQLAPPMVEAKNLAPNLIVESTIVAPQLETLRALKVPIGDPNGVAGPPSAGPGTGNGIGTGRGTGIGDGRGPGAGRGDGGGTGGGIFNIGGGVSQPTILSQVQPEYSDDARKARVQGTVELLIVVRTDGTVMVENVQKTLGYGLDQKAIEAVKQWKFRPSRKDGQPVPVYVSVLVNFSLR